MKGGCNIVNNQSQLLINPYIFECSMHYCPPGTQFEFRTVRFYEIELMVRGTGKIATGEQVLEVSRGDIVFRNPGMKVQGFSGYGCYAIVFDPVYCESRTHLYQSLVPYWLPSEDATLPEYGFFENFPLKYATSNYAVLESLFVSIYNEFSLHHQQNQLYMKGILLQIISLIYQELRDDKTISLERRSIKNNYEKITICKKYIYNHLPDKFTLDGLAQLSGLSRNFFCKIFREITGKTPFDYINETRIKLAKQLLTTTDMNIGEISSKCGFDDITYFYRVFKRYLNMTPTTFRERARYFHKVEV